MEILVFQRTDVKLELAIATWRQKKLTDLASAPAAGLAPTAIRESWKRIISSSNLIHPIILVVVLSAQLSRARLSYFVSST